MDGQYVNGEYLTGAELKSAIKTLSELINENGLNEQLIKCFKQGKLIGLLPPIDQFLSELSEYNEPLASKSLYEASVKNLGDLFKKEKNIFVCYGLEDYYSIFDGLYTHKELLDVIRYEEEKNEFDFSDLEESLQEFAINVLKNKLEISDIIINKHTVFSNRHSVELITKSPQVASKIIHETFRQLGYHGNIYSIVSDIIITRDKENENLVLFEWTEN